MLSFYHFHTQRNLCPLYYQARTAGNSLCTNWFFVTQNSETIWVLIQCMISNPKTTLTIIRAAIHNRLPSFVSYTQKMNHLSWRVISTSPNTHFCIRNSWKYAGDYVFLAKDEIPTTFLTAELFYRSPAGRLIISLPKRLVRIIKFQNWLRFCWGRVACR